MSEEPNLEYVDKLAGEDKAFRQKFITILKNEFPRERQEYEANLEDRNYPEAAENVHKLKHKFNVLGLYQSHALAVRYEAELRECNHSLHTEFLTILDRVETYLKTI